jgi:arylsulfatase A-like enzyme
MSTPRRNILLLFTDDQRFDTLAALGNSEIQTPHLDELVAGGTSFTRAHIMGGSSGAVCMPSRAMLHTGRTLYRIQQQGQEIPPDHITLGEHLQTAGYETFGTGKWHNGTDSYARSFSDGAEIFFGGMNDHWNVPACHFDPAGRYGHDRPICPDAFYSNRVLHFISDHTQPGKHSTDLFADATIDFLTRRTPEKPFFAYVSFMAPHDPRTMPQEFLDLYDPDQIELPANYMPEHPFDNGCLHNRDEQLEAHPRTPEAIRRHIAEYYAMITHLDHAVGRIIQALKDSGQYENTMILFAGDNGLAVGQHGLMGKQNLYDHSVRVPLIFAGPGIPSGQQRPQLCYLLDIFPTLCDLLDMDVPDSVEGKSLLPAIQDENTAGRDCLHLAYTMLQRGVRDDRHKLIEYVVEGKRTTQLFDLQDDPWELTNLADHPARQDDLHRLRDLLRKWQSDYGDTAEQGQAFWTGYDA